MFRRTICFAALLIHGLCAQEQRVLHDGWRFAPGGPQAPPAGSFRPVTMPATFEDLLGPAFDQSAWYAVRLPVTPADRGARLRVVFHAVATETRVFQDGVEIGRHLGAWTPFRVELREPRLDGSDELFVFVDEKVGHNTQGFHPIIQPHFGGIWQDVVLHVDRTPTIDRCSLFLFGDGATRRLALEAPVLPGASGTASRLRVALHDGRAPLASTTLRVENGVARGDLVVPDVRLWSPAAPHCYRAVVQLEGPDGRVVDTVVRPVGFRALRAEGRRLTWNGAPLQVRGVLHWGYEPPAFAPNPDPSVWRRELEDLRALGFNLVKACLWVPPRAFYEIADEVGVLVWQEYPTWHPTLTKEHLAALRAEFEEFHRHDRSFASVAFRSLTCETGHSAELDVIRELYDRCKALVPQTLVVDDSSWITWHRVHDFYDDHPYGNNGEWPARLASFETHIRGREPKPLLLGECITGDTWVDLEAWLRRHGDTSPWFMPRCLPDQRRFEAWAEREFGPATRARLLPDSLTYVMRNRKYQIERLRLDQPDAGYVVSVLRDFTLARMGFYDPHGDAKWDEAAWQWHRDTMLCLDMPGDRRALRSHDLRIRVRVSHYGSSPLRATLRLRLVEPGAGTTAEVTCAPGQVSPPIEWAPALGAPQRPLALTLTAELTGSHALTSSWQLWLLPEPEPPAQGVRVVEALDRATLAFLREGGAAVLKAGERRGSLKTHAQQYYRGAPLSPSHPLHARVPVELLQQLQTFDLETPRVLLWDNLRDQVDPILALWDTHDLNEVRSYLLAFDTRVGKGRLVASTFATDGPAGSWLLHELIRHAAHGDPPRRALADGTLDRLDLALRAEVKDLVEWELRFDPTDRGLAEGFPAGGPTEGWTKVRAGLHWEKQGFAQRDGVAWYRTTFDVPAHWRGERLTAVFEGVDDSFRLYVNGEEVARFGDPATKDTVWLQRVTADVSRHLRPGANQVVLRVVDHGGAGGLWRPVFLTTGAADAPSDLVH
jgi:hypothetical protein